MANSNIVITDTLKNSFAKEFIHSFTHPESSYYLFIGKPLPWANDSAPLATDIETANTTYDYMKDVWLNMISAKKIGGDSVKFALPRKNWTANTKYMAWDDKSNVLFSSANSMYVVTSNNDVYKCIANGNSGITLTGNEPITADNTNNNGFVKKTDGYIWKYIYSLETSDNLFLTNDYMSVLEDASPSVTPNYLIPGTIDRMVIEARGTAYNTFSGNTISANTLSIVTITGDGSGAVATCNVGIQDGIPGSIIAVDMVSNGTGYTYANVSIGGTSVTGGGTGAIARPIISPRFGHGFSPARELGSNSVFLAVRVGKPDSTEANTFPTTANNSYRQFGILKNPYKYGTTTMSNTSSVSQTTNISVIPDASPAYTVGQWVYQTNSSGNTVFSAVIVDVAGNIVKCTHNRGAISVGLTLYGVGSASAKKVSSYTNPAFELHSGQILYIENVSKITRNANQAETYKIIFGF